MDEQTENLLKRYVSQRGVLKGQLSRFETFLNAHLNQSDKVQISERLARCYSTFDNFESVQTEIEMLDDSDAQRAERVIFENKYFKLISAAKTFLNPSLEQQFSPDLTASNVTNQTSQNCNNLNIKLPPIELPTFSGEKYANWLPFFETFNALVHSNNNLSKIQKFYYLQASLKYEAKQVIQSLEVTEKNYDAAVDLLRERYENQRLIINNHVKSIVNMPLIQKESHIALRKLIDSVQRDLKALQSLKEPVEQWDTLLIFIISAKLDSVTRREWEIHSLKEDNTKFEQFIQFLKNKCQILETMQSTTFDSKRQIQNHMPDKFNSFKRQSHSFFVSFKSCPFCDQNHKFFQCRKFLNLSSHDRLKEVKRLKLCAICLQSDHASENCSWSSKCKYCGKAHNSLLHINSQQNSSNQHPENANTFSQMRNNHTQNYIQNHTQSDPQNHTQNNSQKHSNNYLQGESQNYSHSSNQFQPQSTHGQTPNQNLHTRHSATHFATSRDANLLNSEASVFQQVETISTHSCHTTPKISCILATAYVTIFDNENKPHQVRALLDPGSMTNFITNKLCDKLGLSKQNINLSVLGVSTAITSSTKMTRASIKSLHSSYHADLNFYLLDKITERLPLTFIDPRNFILPEGITLADETFYLPGEIGLLLSADIYYELICTGKIKMGKNQPYLLETKLGWIVSGKYNFHEAKGHISNSNSSTYCNLSVLQSQSQIDESRVSDQLEKFWKIEESLLARKYTSEEQETEDLFKNTTRYEKDGHFIVTLPVKQGFEELSNNMDIAIKRFHNLERKLEKNSEVKKLYVDFMNTYENLGHMSRIPKDEVTQGEHPIYYLPHHPVIRETSTTCKLRVVFDASCKTSKGISLNDKLKVGPIIQDDLYSILVRFRKHNYVIGADIAKMYRMIWIEPTQRDLQRIVWRSTQHEELQHYRLNTVTYGTAPASFLAIRSLHEAAKRFEQVYPLSSQSIMQDFYVDDYLSGSDTREFARKLKKEVSEILSNSGFELRKWTSNDRTILDESAEPVEKIEHYIMEDNQIKTLGILWQVDQDILKYSVTLERNIQPTKRNILSVISRIFDPLGLIGPVIVRAKIILQKIWTENLDWDDTVSPELQKAWNEFSKELPLLEELKFPRHAFIFQAVQTELHGYCDASEQAYGACIYTRSVDNIGNIVTRLLCAKSKVAPLKTISLPRLELCGALLLAKLMSKTVEALHAKIEDIFYWSDSIIVLSWLASEPAQLKTFVGNRVSEIQKLTKVERWSHVSSQDNPADIISRGYNPTKFIESTLWWQGPTWLKESSGHWPTAFEIVDPPEQRTAKTQVFLAFYEENLFTRFSSLLKLQRVLSYCFRFINNLKFPNSKILSHLTVKELEFSLDFLIRQAQLQDFSIEINCLQQNKLLPKSSKLISLNPFLDPKGILRLGGRISKSQADYDKKFPILLSGKHPLTELIIKREHMRNMHMGTQALLANVRAHFWPLSGRNAVKRVLRKCVICFRNKPASINTLMGELPHSRVLVSRPFYNTGIDYAGPFYTKASKLRNSKILKSYLCIFVCMSSKAVHIEVVSDLSTDAFLNALKRFFSRRGKSRHLFSDNGSNFIGANRELQALTNLLIQKSDILSNNLSQDGVTWHFIPPRSAHFGGLWESCVKSAKYHLKRVIGDINLTFEELSTIVAQVEACMNSRPICPLSDDPTDLNPLTPGHFLIGGPLVALPQDDFKDTPMNRLSKYQHLSKMIQHFWSRWSSEYLPSLNPRSKWFHDNSKSLKEGQMVLLKDETLPPLKWPIARILALHPGQDNVVRVVSVRTSSGVTKRAINKVAVLPIDQQ